uniref:Ig-like domain-containing protein n=1 Tax=Biomphalaria glabrata TaxID=6526 RepID=A0A2C9L9P0_BIOGL
MSFSITCVKSENAFDLMTMTLTCNNKTVTKQANAITVYHDFRDQITCTCIAHYQDLCNISYETSSGYSLTCTSPVVYVNDGNSMIVHNSETNITITCRGLESENYYSNITLTCLGMTISDLGTSTTLYAVIRKRDHGSSCTCTIKSLYCDENRTSEFILDFSYDTGVIHYMVNNNSQEVEISEGEMLEFVCLVESYPKPDIVIKSDGSSLLNETWKPNVTSLKTEYNIWAIHFVIANSSCLNTNNYSCMESNPVTLTQSQTSVSILVKCSLHVYEFDSSSKYFEYHIDDEAAISVKLYGHPQPTDIQLLKGTDSREINQTKYSANFTELKKPLILVNLIIHKIQEEDFTNYLLRADNGVGKPLLWEFMVVKGDSILDIDIVLTVSLIIGFLVLISALVYIAPVRYKMKRNQKDRNRQVRPRRNDGDQKTFFNPRYSTSTVSENFLPKVSEIDEDRNSIGMCSLNTDLSSK